MPESMEDAQTALEAMKFEIAAVDPSLFTQEPASRASSTTAPQTNSPRST
jgi:hypothetical protein